MKKIKIKSIAVIALTLILTQAYANKEPEQKNLKPRIVVLTDIAPNDIEPDDIESMIRLLVHADQFEIEALIATTGWSNTGNNERIDLIYAALDPYEKDLPNLKKRSNQKEFANDESTQEIGYWPSVNYLRLRTKLGSKKMGMKFIGDGNGPLVFSIEKAQLYFKKYSNFYEFLKFLETSFQKEFEKQ